MHRAIGFVSKRLVQIRPGEGGNVLLTFLYFFLLLTAYYLIKPVARSLALSTLGFRTVPGLDIISALAIGPLLALFARLAGRVPPRAVSRSSFLGILAMLLGFWRALAQPAPLSAGAFYVWVSLVSVVMIAVFWLLANALYRPQEMTRLFSFIGSGGILGGLAGSAVAAVGAQFLGSRQLLLLSSAALILCWGIAEELWSRAAAPAPRSAPPAPARQLVSSGAGQTLRLISCSRYLVLLLIVVVLNKLVSTLVTYQFNPFIERAFSTLDARTTFLGLFLGGMNVASFLVQFFWTSWVLRRWGLTAALMALPLGVLMGTAGLLFLPAFGLAALTELYDGSMNYSLQQTTKEALFLPIDRSIREQVKPFIDLGAFRIGKGLAAVLGLAVLGVAGASPATLSFLIVPLMMAWLIAAIWLRREYGATIRTMLQARARALRPRADEPEVAREPSEPEPFGALTDSQLSRRKLALVGRLLGASAAASPAGRELLEGLAAYDVRLAGALEVDGQLPRLRAIVSDATEPMARRRRALRSLVRTDEQEVVDVLAGMMVAEPDAVLRQEAVIGLVKLRLRGGRLEFPLPAIRRQAAREVANYQRIRQLAAVCRRHQAGPSGAEEPVESLLKVLLEESVEQIFRYLMLLYHPDDIHLVYEQLQAPEPYLRWDAIAMLDTLVDPAMRAALAPVLDEEQFLAGAAEDHEVARDPLLAARLLQAAIWDQHCWLNVAALCAVGRMRLPALQPELERASRDAAPLVSAAAKVALELAAAT